MDSRPSVEKSHSFGGYGPQSQHRLARGDSVGSAKSSNYSKHDSSNSQPTWRLSSSSSGFVHHRIEEQTLRRKNNLKQFFFRMPSELFIIV